MKVRFEIISKLRLLCTALKNIDFNTGEIDRSTFCNENHVSNVLIDPV